MHESGVALPLHCALMRNLGVMFTELLALDELAADCAEDGQYTFLYTFLYTAALNRRAA